LLNPGTILFQDFLVSIEICKFAANFRISDMDQVKKKEKRYKVVLGSLYGDEGKGSTVQWLCKEELDERRKPIVVRFSGGAQAAHTIMQRGDNRKVLRHICSSLGSGVLLGVDTYLDENFFLDPIMLMEEIDTLLIELADSGTALGKDFYPKVWINDWCRIVTPYDIIANRKDLKIKEHGTTGKGIFTTHTRYSRGYGINPLLKISVKNAKTRVTSIFNDPQKYLDEVKDYYGYPHGGDLKDLCWEVANASKITTIEELDWKFCDAVTRIKREISSSKENIKIREEDFTRSGLYDTIIYEGSQGLLLDGENGFDPWTTSSLVGLNGIPRTIVKGEKANDVDVYLVMRTTLTRHGMGQYESHIRYEYGSKYFREIIADDYEYNETNDNQGRFHNTVFNIGTLDRAVDRHKLDNYPVRYHIVITHADAISKYVANSSADHPDFKNGYLYWSSQDRKEHTRLFPVIDRDGAIKEVCNIHEFKSLITDPVSEYLTHSMLANKWSNKRVIDCWYSDNPYSEFKRC